jgi:uncharacterized protein (DUF952 family)
VTVIVHALQAAEWAAAKEAGEYRPPSLAEEGFVHCSKPGQIVVVADRVHAEDEALVLLVIDESRLDAPVRYESPAATAPSGPDAGAPDGTDAGPEPDARAKATAATADAADGVADRTDEESVVEEGPPDSRFPHVYGPIATDAVVAALPFERDATGFRLPAALLADDLTSD